jgi:hypothetical protein
LPGGFLSNIKFSVDKQRAEGDNIDKKEKLWRQLLKEPFTGNGYRNRNRRR